MNEIEGKKQGIFQVMTDPRGFIARNPKIRFFPFLLLSWLYGMVFLFEYASQQALGLQYSFWTIIIGSFIIAPFAGMISILLSSILLLWTGKILKGKATFMQIVSSVSWSKLPQVFIFGTWFLLFIGIGNAVFTASLITGKMMVFVKVVFWIQIVFYVWGFIILLHTLGQMQQFSAWMALWNVIFKAIILTILGLIIVNINQKMIYPAPLGRISVLGVI